jgi:hypothetical protein
MCLSVLLLVAAIAGSDRRPLERRWRIFIPAASVADFRSMFLIRLDGCSRQWLLQRFQGVDLQDRRQILPCFDVRRCRRRMGARTLFEEESGPGCNFLIFQGP